MKVSGVTRCYLGPEISPEQFIPEHFFLYLCAGKLVGFDGYQKYELQAGEACFVKKHHLARYSKQPIEGRFEKVVIVFDSAFLQAFWQRHPIPESNAEADRRAFVPLSDHALLRGFIASLTPYYGEAGRIDPVFADLKREELLLILLRLHPELGAALHEQGPPAKAELAQFMSRHYMFNISIERFAWLSGRSLSSFKREFRQVFGETPARWLVGRRLEEAHFLLAEQGQKPSEIYQELGFEDFSHFSHAFKKRFGYPPGSLATSAKN